MRRRLIVWACSLSLGASLLMTECDRYAFLCSEEGPIPQGLTAQDMVGTYRGKPFGTLTVRADGTFTASDWADYDIPLGFEHLGVLDGVWKLRVPVEHTRDGGDEEAVVLHDPAGKAGGSFYITGSRQRPRLYRYAGDPDECTFHEFTDRR